MKCPDFANSLSLFDRERRESRAPTAPATSCAAKKAHELVTTGSAVHSGFPRTMVLAACFVLSPVSGPSCHRRRRIAHRLDARVAAPGPHDFAVRQLNVSSGERSPAGRRNTAVNLRMRDQVGIRRLGLYYPRRQQTILDRKMHAYPFRKIWLHTKRHRRHSTPGMRASS